MNHKEIGWEGVDWYDLATVGLTARQTRRSPKAAKNGMIKNEPE
jgi:hypothetical protein